MNKSMRILTLTIVLMIALVSQGFSAEHKHKKGDHETGNSVIHESKVDDFGLRYELIDMAAKMKEMPDMPEMKMTHHLMVFVKDAQGHAVTQAKVGYLIQGPDKSKQKTMCMAMSGGFGADVNFKAKGVYTVMVKVIAGDKKMKDTFEYEVK